MQTQTQRSPRGRHRKFNASQTTKGRIALVAVATGAVSTAGVGGAAAAQLQAESHATENTENGTPVDFQLATDAAPEAVLGSSAPQILTLAEYKPVINLEEQIDAAVQYNTERVEADLAARAAEAVRVEGATVAQSADGAVAKPAEGAFTSGFGPRWGTFHNGIDIANAEGTPILAVMDGTVVDSGPASGYGNWIRIKHDNGALSIYGHMSSLNVAVGERVTAGQQIAGMGNLGFSTGTHLHFEIHPDGNTPVDPVPWFAERGISI
ncbi:Murein hydrolase activator NlpD precursor [Corynebacterium occultum]|uniref:Murein hydrolase activator NlpD n=1 Tax=Corynebacterium occultum TaxID=2675219 RepID=A0A6B8W477_9CORY|nr:M23 family metallopeptidase [Corynebacterium occultum]QGU06737.1 Murein hydrolase activator NlpD precursor [Corynebacterium occultum]